MSRAAASGVRALRLAGAVAVCALSSTSLAQAQGPSHRFAMFIGNNTGGEGTRPLVYAEDDATRLRDVFVRLGGVKPDDALLLLGDSAEEVLTALSELERRAKAAATRGEQTSLFFYYSGHAKDGALRLGSSALPLSSLKQRLAQGPAQIRVAVFDACRSGALTRTKGVRRAPAFEVETDATRAAKGLVILTSSASDEDSQESDLIGASYFSYHLSTGLLGSADHGGDGRVSLAEAYAFAYERTVASTADSASGPQHPTFSFDLAGNGDLVLTDVAQRREGLRIPAQAPAGTYFIIDGRGVVVAELAKADSERLIALAPGGYTIKRRLADHLRIGEVSVAAGQVTVLDEAKLRRASFSDDPVKGTGLSATYSPHWSIAVTGQYQSIFDAPTTAGGLFPSAALVGLEATRHNFFGRGFSLTMDMLFGSADAQVSTALLQGLTYRYGVVTVGGAIVYEWQPAERLVPFAGVRLGFNLMTRDFADAALPSQSFSTMSPGVLLGLKWRFARSFSALARARVHYLLYNIDETRNLGYAELGLSLSYEFKE